MSTNNNNYSKVLHTTEQFIAKAVAVHGDVYDYSRSVYLSDKEKIEIICKKHGSFWQQAGSHKSGAGCRHCAVEISKNNRKNSFSKIIKLFRSVHGKKYDYGQIKEDMYVNNMSKLPIVCAKHGLFHKTFVAHYTNRVGCDQCSKANRRKKGECDLKWFLKTCKKVHGDRYDYSKINESNYKSGGGSKIEIVCRVHGSFWQNNRHHAVGRLGCGKCSGLAKYTIQDFIDLSVKQHGDLYDYSKVVYKSNKSMVTLICTKHGDFVQRADRHLRGEGCPKCGKQSMADLRRLSYDDFLKKAKSVHGNKYEYLGFVGEYKTVDDTQIRAVCKKHGEFFQTIHAHLGGCGCVSCKSSKGETRIKDWLDLNNIPHTIQKKFDGCVNPETQRRLPYDFYIPHKNLLIEFDGKQHFIATDFGAANNDVTIGDQMYEEIRKRDKIKNKFAKKHKINLLRIKYTQFDEIEHILEQHICKPGGQT